MTTEGLTERSIIIAPLTRSHKRTDFDCGEATLNNYLRSVARQSASRHHSRTYVACPEDAPQTIAGFYTLTLNEKRFAESPPDYETPPTGSVPVALIGQLGVDRSFQGRRLGELLLLDALRRAHAVADLAGCCAVEVVAINNSVLAFYQKYGFVSVDEREPYRLYLSMKAVIKQLGI